MKEYEELKLLTLAYSDHGVTKTMDVRPVKDFEDLIVSSCFEGNDIFKRIFWKRNYNNLALQVLQNAFFIDKLLSMAEIHLGLISDVETNRVCILLT